ncbi:Two-component system sensor histidine kinase [hydrothermal vent metagenome]|uniref:Signal transduction histidine-protein kinase/phosphatase MprB n=1 Tax=hydrothermal vent metagenome TaxID=652676 RepID=A0A3B0SVM3_9ZZZZ
MRKRLALLSLAVASLVVVAFLVPVAVLIRNQAQTRALSAAERDAQSVAAALAVSGVTDPSGEITPSLARTVLAAFGNPEGLSIIFSESEIVGADVVWSANIEQAQRPAAFTAKTEGGAEVLVGVLLPDTPGGEHSIVVRAFVADAELAAGVPVAWAMLIGLGIFLVGVAMFAADRLGRSIVRPVIELSDAAHRLGDGDLDVRVVPDGPDEIAEVGEAFNTLAGRLDALLVAERESVADLSHRLRTPLTALRLQAEMLSDPMESAQLKADIDDLERAVDELIQTARSRSVAGSPVETVDLGEVVRHRSGFWRVLAEEQNRSTTARVESGDHPVALPRSDLGALIDVLIENVFAHTPEGAGYRIVVRAHGEGGHSLTISDDGDGFADLGVMQRGRSGAGGTGLGLDIVVRTAERTGGGIRIGTSATGGAEIEVVFGSSSLDTKTSTDDGRFDHGVARRPESTIPRDS